MTLEPLGIEPWDQPCPRCGECVNLSYTDATESILECHTCGGRFPRLETPSFLEKFHLVDGGEIGYQVHSFSPGAPEENKPFTEIHLVLQMEVKDDKPVAIIMRLKSAAAVDQLIGELIQERVLIWGQPEFMPDENDPTYP